MTINNAIAHADRLRPNMIQTSEKIQWIYKLEAEVAELMGIKAPPDIRETKAGDAELLMPFPHDLIYELYLCAMIDFAQQDMALYTNDMEMANAAISDAFKWWRREHRPSSSGNVKVM